MKTLDAPQSMMVVRKGPGVLEVVVLPPRRDDDDGIGVPVPVGPRPRKGGAAAAPPPRRELVEA